MNEKDITPDELIEILKQVKYYCKHRSCYGCLFRKRDVSLGVRYCMLHSIPYYWEIDESEETKINGKKG